ncbi:MAG: endo-1,4-beta-xylanase, partial [Candidatus Symbiothrix sp.]|nr:endo-1,4-beta-xylanase [Candidatus Symbiothrix sp.]
MKKIFLLFTYLAIISIVNLNAQTVLMDESFEQSGSTVFITGWTGTTTNNPMTRPTNATNAHTGSRYMQISIPASTPGNPWNYVLNARQLTVSPDHVIRLSFWMRMSTTSTVSSAAIRVSTATAQLMSEETRADRQYLPTLTITPEWTKYTYDIVYGERLITGTTALNFTFDVGTTANAIMWLDDVVIEDLGHAVVDPLNYNEDYTNAAAYDFEVGGLTNGWSILNPGEGIEITTEDKHGGDKSVKAVNGTGTDAWSLQLQTPEITIKPAHQYKIFFWAKAVGGSGKLRISTSEAGQLNTQYLADKDISGDWAQYVYEFSSGTTILSGVGTSLKLNFDMGYIANKTYYIDDIYLVDLTEDPIDWTPGDAATQPLAQNHKKFLGSAMGSTTNANFGKYWDQVTPENGGKWGTIQSNITSSTYNWTQADLSYNYAKNNGLYFKWHTFAWGSQEPTNLGTQTAEVQRTKFLAYMDAVKARYTDIELIDVVNEPFHENFSMAEAIGGAGETGWDWVIWVFEQARERFPKSKLLINEYGIISDLTAAANYLQIINILKERHLIDGIGIQCHTFNIDGASAASIKASLDLLGTAGLPIYVSELDIADASEKVQRKRYAEKFPILWEHPSVAGITLWGYVTGQTWRDNTGIVSSAALTATEREAMKWLKLYTVSAASQVENKFIVDVTLDEYRLGQAGTLQGTFDSMASAYTLNVGADVTSINIAMLTANRLATVSGGDTRTLTPGTNTITFTVTGEDGVTTKEYTLTVIRTIPSAKTEYIIQKLFPVTATTTYSTNQNSGGLYFVSSGSSQMAVLRANGAKTTEDGAYGPNLPDDCAIGTDRGMKNLLRFQTSGNTTGDAMPTRCYAYIDVPGESTITVYGMAGSNSRSILNISDGNYILGSLDVSESAATLFKKTVKYYSSGRIYFFVDNATTTKNFYIGVIVVGSGEDEDPIDAPGVKSFDFESASLAEWDLTQESGATIAITSEDKHVGKYATKITTGTGGSATSVQMKTPEITLVPGHDYRLSFWAKATTAGGNIAISIDGGQLVLEKGAPLTNLPNKTMTTGWESYFYDIVLSGDELLKIVAAGDKLRFNIDFGATAGKTYYIDDVLIEDMTLIEGSKYTTNIPSPLAVNHAKFLGEVVGDNIPGGFETSWNQLTSNVGAWGSVEAVQGTKDWSKPNIAYNFATTHNFPFIYNALLNGDEPAWLGELGADEQKAAWETYIADVATTYPALQAITVVDAPLSSPSAIREALGGEGVSGYDWIVNAYEKARSQFPTAKLLLNESGLLNDVSAAAKYAEIIYLLIDKGFLDGISIKVNDLSTANVAQIEAVLNTYGSTNLPVYISDINATAENADKIKLLWKHPSVAGLTLSEGTVAPDWINQYFALPASQVYNQFAAHSTPLAGNHSKFFGNVTGGSIPGNYDIYWNQITPENASKWGSVEPVRGYMRWADVDVAYAHAKKMGYPFKFHTFIWGSQEPGWFTRADITADEFKAEVHEYMRLAAERYPDIDLIDVVNEPTNGHAPSTIRNAFGGNGSTGWDWVVWSFQTAKQYFPKAKLLINDYNIVANSTTLATTYAGIVNILKASNLIDGIGVQCHAATVSTLTAAQINNCLNVLANTGLPVYVSELDIYSGTGTDNQNTQSARYQTVFPALWQHNGVAGITAWGYIFGSTWLVNTGLVNADGTERAAMTWLKSYFASSSSQVTNQFLSTDASLASLAVSEGNISFSPTTYTYALEVENVVSLIEFEPVANDEKSGVSGPWFKALNVGANVVTFTVTAENKTSQTYEITINRKALIIPDLEFPDFDEINNIYYVPGMSLANISLADMGTGDGTYAWENPTTALNAGSYSYNVVFTPNPATFSQYDYTDIELTQSVSLTINPRNIDNEAVTISITDIYLVYTGQQLTPAFTDTKDGSFDLTSADYDYSFGNNINVSDGGSIVLSGKGNYTGTKTFAFVIQKAPVTITLPESQSTVYTGFPIGIEPVLSGSLTVNSLLSGLSSQYEGIEGTKYASSATAPVLPGNYKVTVSVPGDSNHESAVAATTFVILKLVPNPVLDDIRKPYDGLPTFDPTDLPQDLEIRYFYEGYLYLGDFYPFTSVPPVDAGNYTETIEIDGNAIYESRIFTIRIVIERAEQVIDFPAIPVQYVGNSPFYLEAQSRAGLALSYSIDDITVAEVTAGGLVTPKAVGTAYITAQHPG